MNVSDRLGELIKHYRKEARKCARGKAYFGATILEVSALEATLQAMCFVYWVKVKRTTIYKNKKFRRKIYKAFEFKLYDLIRIADELGWFPNKKIRWGGKLATLAGFAHEIRKIRNYVHPEEWARRPSTKIKFTKGVYRVVCEVCDVANSWLLHSIEQDLLRRMKRDRASQGG